MPDFSKTTGEEAEAYIRQEYWPHCFMHIHGREVCIISHNWAEVERLRKIDSKFMHVCGPQRVIDWRLSREEQKEKEDYLWRLTAAWLREKRISGTI